MTITSRRPLADNETWGRECRGRGILDMTMHMCRACDGEGRVPKKEAD